MAEIEHFVDPLDKSHPKFKNHVDVLLPLLDRESQSNLKEIRWVTIGEAVATKMVNNETLGYFMVRIYQFLQEVGVNVKDHLRFRQHMQD